MLTDLLRRLPPRLMHVLARWLRLVDVHAMFCPCCAEWDDWPEEP